MSEHDLSFGLLLAAKSDLKAIEHMNDAVAFDDRVFGFHAQQAAEKALKAWLNCLGEMHPFTHDLSLLLHRIEEKGAEIGEWWELVELNPYAVQLRYEMLPVGERPLERETILEMVSHLVRRVEALLA